MQNISGQHIKGYELQERIGTGGFGAVYRAYQSTVGREVAMKIILPGYANHPDFIRRFEAEAHVIARLEHPYIVPLHDYWRDPDGAYLVMRYLRGGSLHDGLQKQGALPIEEAVNLIEQVTQALHIAHRNQVIHRDIKPGNILLDEDGNAYLADFGIAKDHTISQSITDPDGIIGSPDYLAPEQARSEAVTPQTDIYSLGVVLYEILEGKHPFPAHTPIERLYKHLNEPLPDLVSIDDTICKAVNEVIQKATAKNPQQRFQDVIAFAQALREAAALSNSVATTSLVELLTPREQEVLKLVIEGKSNREIADALVIEVSTVKSYINQLYRKLNVRSRVQAIVKARELDLIVGKPQTQVLTSSSNLPEPENPYKGLRAFQAADAQDFFGREKLIQKLLKRLLETTENHRFLAVVGPSGSGKSSVVKAGLIPALWRGELPNSDNWYIVDMLPGDRPLDELEVALLRVADDRSLNLHEQLERDAHGLLRIADLILPDTNSELLLVIDQFEEVFTLVTDENERLHFLNLLHEAVTRERSRVRVIVTLRADYYDRPLQYPDFGELIRSRVETILPLSAEELEHAVREPASSVGVRFEDGLVSRIVSDVHYQPGALPLLQYALTELFERRDGRTLTQAAYQAIGGTGGALAHRADEIYLEQNEAGRELIRQIFLRLVTLGEGAEDTRRRVPRSELLAIAGNKTDAIYHVPTNHSVGKAYMPSAVNDKEMMDEIIDLYAASRLLSLDNDPATRTPTVEVAHEAILREWERLRAWLNASREDIRQQRIVAVAADAWQTNKRDTSYLLSGTRLEQVEKWQKSTELALTPLEREFIESSITQRSVHQKTEAERQEREIRLERRSRDFLRGLVAVFAIATLIAIGLSIFAFNQSSIAQTERERAENQTLLAEENAARAQNVALVAGSQAALTLGNTDTALALAMEAVTLDPTSARAQVALSEAAYTPGTVRVFSGHTSGIDDVAISPDGLTVLSASWDTTLILWDIETGAILRRFEGHSEAVHSAKFSPDGLTAISGSADKTAILWDVQTGQIIRRFEGYNNEIYNIVLSPDGGSIIVGGNGDDSDLIQWDVQTGQIIQRFERQSGVIEGVVFSPDGLTVLSVSSDKTMTLWDVQTGQIIRQLGLDEEDNLAGVLSVAISPDGRTALSGDTSAAMMLWDLSTDEVLHRFDTTHGWVVDVAFSPDGRYALSSGGSSTIALWDLQTGNLLREFHGHQGIVFSLAFTADGRHIVSGSGDGTLRLWDLNAGYLIRRFADGQSKGWHTDRSPDGRTAISTSEAGTATLWDIESGQAIRQFTDDQPVVAVDFSPDGRMALIGTGYTGAEKIEPGHVILWDIESGEEIRRFTGHPYVIYDVDISPDGRMGVSTGAGGAMILWDIESGEEIRRFHGYESDNPGPSGIWGVEFSPDGHTILSQLYNGTLILWDTVTGEEIRQYVAHTAGGENLHLHHDGRMALSTGYDNLAILWDVATGNIIHRLTEHTGGVWDATFSPNGQFALTSSGDGTTLLWDLNSGEAIRRYNASFYQAAFSPDGTDAFVNFNDASPELWRVDATLDNLISWVQANRYIPELTCEQRELYQVEPLCETE